MKSSSVISKTASDVYGAIQKELLTLEENNMAMLKVVKDDPFETGFAKIQALIDSLAAVVSGTRVDGIGFPQFLYNFDTAENDLSEVRLTVRSKLKAEPRIKETRTISVGEDFVEEAGVFMADMALQMYYLDCASENVSALNEKLSEVYEANADITKKFFFEVTTTTGRVVAIDNDTVILKAKVDEAHSIGDYGIMAGYGSEVKSEFETMVEAESIEKLVSIMRTVTTTQEILKKRIDLVEKLGNLKTRRSAYKLIREGVHKKAQYVPVGAVGYVLTGDDENIFGLVKKTEAGYETVLAPFDIETNEVVDMDITEKIA